MGDKAGFDDDKLFDIAEVELDNQQSAPELPDSSHIKVFSKDGIAHRVNSSGEEVSLEDTGSNDVTGSLYQLTFARTGSANNKFLGHESNGFDSNKVFAIIPFKSKLASITFSNRRSGVDTDVEVHVVDANATKGCSPSTKVFTWDLDNVRLAHKSDFASSIVFDQGDKVAIFLKDKGTNPDYATVTIYLQVTDNTTGNNSENFSCHLSGSGTTTS